MKRPDIHISDFTYALPDSFVAKFPLAARDASKLLVYRGGLIQETVFSDLPSCLTTNSLLVFNNTKVIQARLKFKRETGAEIEIFCLDPVFPKDYSQVFATPSACVWNCIVGNLKKWKAENLVLPFEFQGEKVLLKAEKQEVRDNVVRVAFSWEGELCFAQVLEAVGAIPIPPYLHREAQELDEERYQTVYSKYLGSVAAPTAGLHFTSGVLEQLKHKPIEMAEVTLHVGAGTFKPVKTETIDLHSMHAEVFSVKYDFLRRLQAQLSSGKPVVAVGTTSVRTLESLYWLGCLSMTETAFQPEVQQWMPYDRDDAYPPETAIQALIDYMDTFGMQTLEASTQIMIAPSYRFRIVQQIITNFHQPQSTLLLLIGAFIGSSWKEVYDYALEHEFRFLSYGDSSLLIP